MALIGLQVDLVNGSREFAGRGGSADLVFQVSDWSRVT